MRGRKKEEERKPKIRMGNGDEQTQSIDIGKVSINKQQHFFMELTLHSLKGSGNHMLLPVWQIP